MIRIAAYTDIGIEYENNDDKILIDKKIIEEGLFEITKDEYCLAIVCDGIGGENFGDEAARLALKKFQETENNLLDKKELEMVICKANENIIRAQMLDYEHQNMGTTIAGICIKGENYIVFNVGDSRIYRFRKRYLYQLSKDHSLIQDLLDANMITDIDAKNHPKRNIINRYLGSLRDYEPSIRLMTDAIIPGDILLVCSDGITDVLDDEEIKLILHSFREANDLAGACKELVDKAKKMGSQDNLSVILIEL